MKILCFESRLAKSIAAVALTLASLTATSRAAFSTEISLPSVQPQIVVPGDTFSFDISGFNSAGTTGFLLSTPQNPTFGTTVTYTGIGVNGQDITIASSQTVNATTTTNNFTVSTPTNFLTTTMVSGVTITSLQFDLGNANSGSNTVAVLPAITTFTSTGSVLFSGGTLALTPTVTLGAGGLSYAAVEGVNAGTSAISTFNVRQFTFSITYTNVPEPSTLALGAFGLIGGAVGIVRRRVRAKN